MSDGWGNVDALLALGTLRAAGWTWEHIAHEHEVSWQAVHKWWTAMYVPQPRRALTQRLAVNPEPRDVFRPAPLVEADRAEIGRLLDPFVAVGLSVKGIAETVGVSPGAVRRLLDGETRFWESTLERLRAADLSDVPDGCWVRSGPTVRRARAIQRRHGSRVLGELWGHQGCSSAETLAGQGLVLARTARRVFVCVECLSGVPLAGGLWCGGCLDARTVSRPKLEPLGTVPRARHEDAARQRRRRRVAA